MSGRYFTDQNPDSVTSPTAKHQLVRQTVIEEAEKFVGHPFDLVSLYVSNCRQNYKR